MTRIITVDIISDVVCPWCYIGRHRLRKAIEASPAYSFEVSELPFELNPDAPDAGYNYKEHLTEKFGGAEQYALLTERVAAVARQEGIPFDLSKQKTIPNTRRLHALIDVASGDQKGTLTEAFFKAYFVDGIDLTDAGVVEALARTAGLTDDYITKALHTDEYKLRVATQQQIFRQQGVNAVPFFILNGRYGVSGAQSVETFVGAFKQIAAMQPTDPSQTGQHA